ncbi:putative protein stb3 [Golovinomyces cichoracearum]|uniref:Sin3 binding protein n=1 Tax=Golovinomyces cichoracearum TaxID=62708 RepID=A0A420IB29_9PEZI|nr:putative protein stb3 [Golovinomyces cichoracearum]
MASTARDIPMTGIAQEGSVSKTPKTAPLLVRNSDVVISSKSLTMKSKGPPLSTHSRSFPLTSNDDKLKCLVPVSSHTESTSEQAGPHFHQKNKLIQAPVNESHLQIGICGSDDMEANLPVITEESGCRTNFFRSAGITSDPLIPSTLSLYPSQPLPPHEIRAHTKIISRNLPVSEPVDLHPKLHESPRELTKASIDESELRSGMILYDNIGVITPALLAKYHLPEILLNHGPLAIRHIMGFLTTAVPGFSRIPPAKSRRLVVTALEKRVHEDNAKISKSDVIFEKVGWGRWDARLKTRSGSESKILTSPSVPSTCSSNILIDKKIEWNHNSAKFNASDSTWADYLTSFSHEDNMEMDMGENSVGEINSCSSSSEVSDGDEMMSDNSSDTTDDEDWAALGAAALRAASYSSSSKEKRFCSSLTQDGFTRGCGGPHLSALTKSSPEQLLISDINIAAFNTTSNSQEREAVEALMHLSSV